MYNRLAFFIPLFFCILYKPKPKYKITRVYDRMNALIPTIIWNPSRIAFSIPLLHIEIYWYSIFFAIGLLGAYFITRYFLLLDKSPEDQRILAPWSEKLFFWIFAGILIGARLGHVLFYEPLYFLDHPLEIFMTWKGGLSSHGGICGILLSLYFFWKKNHIPQVSLYETIDCMAIGSAWAATAIRIGNFFNQEIIGIATSSQFGIIFLSPMDYLTDPLLPHHPVQLYEAFVAASLLVIMILLRLFWRPLRAGTLAGIYLTTLFFFRFLLEYIKIPQSAIDGHLSTHLQMGQILSIPIFIYGLFLIFRKSVNP